MKQFTATTVLFFCCSLSIWATAHAQDTQSTGVNSKKVHRIALVIGNKDYLHPKDPWTVLNSPKKDAEDITTLLAKNGYKVQPVYNADSAKLTAQTLRFLNKVDDIKADIIERRAEKRESIVALFYFSGHGFSRSGQLFLAAVDGKGSYIEDLTTTSLILSTVTDRLFKEEQVEVLSFLFLDACRNSVDMPSRSKGRDKGASFKGSVFGGVSGSGGVVLFSSSDGKVSIDGKSDQENSIFTRAFISTISKTDESLGIYGFLNEVALETKRISLSEGFRPPQVPELRGSPLSDVRFKGIQTDGAQVKSFANLAQTPSIEQVVIEKPIIKAPSSSSKRNGWVWLGNGDVNAESWVRSTFKLESSGDSVEPGSITPDTKYVATASLYMRESFPEVSSCQGKVPKSGNYAECTKEVGVLNTGEEFKIAGKVRSVPIKGKGYSQYWAQVVAD